MPPEAIRVEPTATNTGQNIEFTRRMFADEDVDVRSVLLVSRPLPLEEYIASIGDTKRVITMLVGDTQRVTEYAKRGFAIEQVMPPQVRVAYQRLIDAGFTHRLI